MVMLRARAVSCSQLALEIVILRKSGGGVARGMSPLHWQPPVTGPPTHLELRGGREGTEYGQGAMARVGPLGPPYLLWMNNKSKTWRLGDS